jgi:hypothetical protein
MAMESVSAAMESVSAVTESVSEAMESVSEATELVSEATELVSEAMELVSQATELVSEAMEWALLAAVSDSETSCLLKQPGSRSRFDPSCRSRLPGLWQGPGCLNQPIAALRAEGPRPP